MIVLRNLTKVFVLNAQRKVVADNINATFPTGVSVGLLGRNGAGKSTLLKLIAGTSHPTRGEVLSTGSVSFPVGLASSLHPDMTGAQNTRFVARIYGADTDELMDWVEDFAELGVHFHLPVRSYSSGMRGRLTFGINMGLAFDTYLIDEITAVGDAAFKRKSAEVFQMRMKSAGAVYVSHSMGQLRELCTAGAMLENGRLTYYPEVEEAIERYMFSLDPGSRPLRSRQGTPGPAREARIPFPDEARMVYGLGLNATHGAWVADCFRRHRACHFGLEREPHYFDIRAGRADAILARRKTLLQELAAQVDSGTSQERQAVLQRLSGLSAVLKIHHAPEGGSDRHTAYTDYMLTRRTNQPAVCDMTPDYARLGAAEFAEMALIGDACFSVTLRDPAARLWEQMLPSGIGAQEAEAQLERLEAGGAEQLLTHWPDADYLRLFAALDEAVPPSRLIVQFHERLDDPATRRAELNRLTTVLEIPPVPDHRLPGFPKPPRIPPLTPGARARLVALLAPQYAGMQARFGALLPGAWRTDLPPPPLAAAPRPE